MTSRFDRTPERRRTPTQQVTPAYDRLKALLGAVYSSVAALLTPGRPTACLSRTGAFLGHLVLHQVHSSRSGRHDFAGSQAGPSTSAVRYVLTPARYGTTS
jgi:hypothetical protein